MTPKLSEIRERLAKATSGPWSFGDEMKIDENGYISISECATMEPTGLQHVNDNCENSGNDWNFICHAPSDIAHLLERVEALRKALVIAAIPLEACKMARSLTSDEGLEEVDRAVMAIRAALAEGDGA
jgi:hypothetical protein